MASSIYYLSSQSVNSEHHNFGARPLSHKTDDHWKLKFNLHSTGRHEWGFLSSSSMKIEEHNIFGVLKTLALKTLLTFMIFGQVVNLYSVDYRRRSQPLSFLWRANKGASNSFSRVGMKRKSAITAKTITHWEAGALRFGLCTFVSCPKADGICVRHRGCPEKKILGFSEDDDHSRVWWPRDLM